MTLQFEISILPERILFVINRSKKAVRVLPKITAKTNADATMAHVRRILPLEMVTSLTTILMLSFVSLGTLVVTEIVANQALLIREVIVFHVLAAPNVK